MNKPNKAKWIEQKLAARRKPMEEEMYRIYQSKLQYDPEGAEIYLKTRKRYIENEVAKDIPHLEDVYYKFYEMPRQVVEKKELPKIRGIEKYAKTRTKAANEMFNLKYLVDDANPKQFVRFVKSTHGRTLKKMLNNIRLEPQLKKLAIEILYQALLLLAKLQKVLIIGIS